MRKTRGPSLTFFLMSCCVSTEQFWQNLSNFDDQISFIADSRFLNFEVGTVISSTNSDIEETSLHMAQVKEVVIENLKMYLGNDVIISSSTRLLGRSGMTHCTVLLCKSLVISRKASCTSCCCMPLSKLMELENQERKISRALLLLDFLYPSLYLKLNRL